MGADVVAEVLVCLEQRLRSVYVRGGGGGVQVGLHLIHPRQLQVRQRKQVRDGYGTRG